jgi:molybdenum cofactor cytidylyltransferase
VLWPRRFFRDLCQLGGDAGARELLAKYASEVRTVTLDTDAIFADVDTPAELDLAQRK